MPEYRRITKYVHYGVSLGALALGGLLKTHQIDVDVATDPLAFTYLTIGGLALLGTINGHRKGEYRLA